MAKIHIGLIGGGGFGRVVMPFALDTLASQLKVDAKSLDFHFLESTPTTTHVNGIQVLSINDFKGLSGQKYFNVTVSKSDIRQRLAEDMLGHADPIALMAGNTTILAANTIGQGAILCPYSTITSNVIVGKFFHSNIYSYVEHDCIIGDYVTFAPGVKCNGNVHIHDHAYIGSGAIIKQGVPGAPLVIGERAVIGMGAVVTKDVPAGATVVGNPAKDI